MKRKAYIIQCDVPCEGSFGTIAKTKKKTNSVTTKLFIILIVDPGTSHGRAGTLLYSDSYSTVIAFLLVKPFQEKRCHALVSLLCHTQEGEGVSLYTLSISTHHATKEHYQFVHKTVINA